MSEPTVPLHIEPMDVLRDRYPAAVETLIDAAAVRDGNISRPSSQAQHVFDTEAGWRLIVSRERFPSGMIAVHLSASIHDNALHARLSQDPAWSVEEIFVLWRYLARSDRTPELVYLSSGGIPHFLVEQVA
jgi:hypothetical protein